MKMKYKIGFMIVVLSVLFLVGCTQPPEDLSHAEVSETQSGIEDVVDSIDDTLTSTNDSITKMIDTELSTFEFEGYAIGKSHVGTFDILSGTLTYDGENVIGASGIIDATSVNTGIKKLDSHLRNDDFFDVTRYAQIIVESSQIIYGDDGVGTITGDLTFHGVTKQIRFPVTVTADSIETDFLLDTTPFNIKYTGVNKDVRIAFTLVAE